MADFEAALAYWGPVVLMAAAGGLASIAVLWRHTYHHLLPAVTEWGTDD